MPESETLVVFRILDVLAKARDFGRALPVEKIAGAAHLDRSSAERCMNLLKYARAVRAEVTPTRPPEYSLTRYGLERLIGGRAPLPTASPQPDTIRGAVVTRISGRNLSAFPAEFARSGMSIRLQRPVGSVHSQLNSSASNSHRTQVIAG